MIESHWVTPPAGIKLKYRGQFDLGKFYAFMKRVIEDNAFLKDEQTLEKEYVEKTTQTGKQIEFAWEAEKKEDVYVKYRVNVSARILVFENANDLDMKFIAWVETGGEDYDKLGYFTKLYHNFIEKKRIPFYQGELYKKVYKFQSEAKKFLKAMDY